MTTPQWRGRLAAAGAVLVAAAAAGNASASHPPSATAASLPALTVRQLAGQRVIYSYRGPTPPRRLLARIRAGEAAGVILFGDNITGRAQIRRVVSTLQDAARQSAVPAPLLIMTDQEGGAVRRLAGAPVRSERSIGASAHPLAAARDAGRGAGLNLRGVGINVNLAPVLDVYRAAGNFIDQFGRSYGRSPHKVARLGEAFIRAQQHTGVAATAKHFPGLGAATRTQNTDLRAVRLDVGLAALRADDELPYGTAVAAGVRLVMTSWATYPALDARRPAGLSSIVVQQELRRRLGFAGVTVTDALGAGALRAFGGTSKRARLAAAAGMDLLLCAGRDGEADRAVDGLANALRSGALDAGAFRAAVARVIALRRTAGVRDAGQ